MRNLLKNVDELLFLSVTTTNKNHKNRIFFSRLSIWNIKKYCGLRKKSVKDQIHLISM